LRKATKSVSIRDWQAPAVHALVVCHDAGGTIPPVIALAEALVERAHDVTVLSQPSVRRRAETLDVPTAVLLHSMWATYTDVWFADLWPVLGEPVNDTRGAFGLDAVDGWPGVFAGHDRLVSAVPSARRTKAKPSASPMRSTSCPRWRCAPS
jgi:hypothetical protein